MSGSPGVRRFLLLALGGLTLPASVRAQAVERLTDGCVAAGGEEVRCTELAVTARALQGHLGLSTGLGSEVAGSAGTLGRRLGATPRIAVEARAAFAHLALPDLADPGLEPSREATFVVPSIRGGITAGVFDGFSLLPTVGGFLSLDLLAHGSVVFLPTSEGFDGRASALTLGARLGILRESFTLPGVSVSLSRRMLGSVRYGSVEGPGGGEVEVDPRVTSVRATVGKDLLAVGVLLGMGWDRYSGSATIRAMTDAVTSDPVASYGTGSFTSSRRLYFAGAAWNFLVLQLSAEAGWASGFGAVTGYRGAPFDPTGGNFYGSVAFRLTI
jgi:hypothetical protein